MSGAKFIDRPVKRAALAVASFIQDMGLNHRRSHIFVPLSTPG